MLQNLTNIIIGNECSWNILCFDETQFTLDGAVNNQNCRIWCSACPYVVHERSLHSGYITVWCDFTAEFILRPFSFEQNTCKGPYRKHRDCSGTESKHNISCFFNLSRNSSSNCWLHYNTFWTRDWCKWDAHWINMFLNKVLCFRFVLLLAPFFYLVVKIWINIFIACITSPLSI